MSRKNDVHADIAGGTSVAEVTEIAGVAEIASVAEIARVAEAPGGARPRRFLAVLFSALVLTACGDLLDPAEPPFVYDEVTLLVGPTSVSRALAIRCSFTNLAPVAITSADISFRLWDESGAQFPRRGDNYVEISFSGSIADGEWVEITTGLDDLVVAKPSVGVEATHFSIHRIRFADGSEWRDRLKQFSYPYPITSAPAEGGD